MSYVSKEAAKALKEVGFTEQCAAFFTESGAAYVGDHVNCHELVTISRPNYLEAGDWLADNTEVCLIFYRHATVVSDVESQTQSTFSAIDSNGHRDLAILEACKIIKERKTNPLP